jgi:signal peptidase I
MCFDAGDLMHKIDAFIGPAVILSALLGVLFYFSNYKLYTLPETPPQERVLMKPAFAPNHTKFSRYWGRYRLRGDRTEAVEFRAPDTGSLHYGRVVAVEGVRVAISAGELLLNGEAVKEPYIKSRLGRPDLSPILVPRDCVFVLLDERSSMAGAALDSRRFGPIPIECITRVFQVETAPWRKSGGG